MSVFPLAEAEDDAAKVSLLTRKASSASRCTLTFFLLLLLLLLQFVSLYLVCVFCPTLVNSIVSYPIFYLLVPHPRENRKVISSSVDREFPEQAYLAAYLKKGDTVLSLGGNVGTVCIFVDKFLGHSNGLGGVGETSSANADLSSSSGSATQTTAVKKPSQLCIEPNPNTSPILEENKIIAGASFDIEKRILARPQKPPIAFASKGIMSHIAAPGEAVTHTIETVDRDLSGYSVVVSDCEGCFCSVLKEFPEVVRDARIILNELDGVCDYDFDAYLMEHGFERLGGSMNMDAEPRHDVFVKVNPIGGLNSGVSVGGLNSGANTANSAAGGSDSKKTRRGMTEASDSSSTGNPSRVLAEKPAQTIESMRRSQSFGFIRNTLSQFLYYRNIIAFFLIASDNMRKTLGALFDPYSNNNISASSINSRIAADVPITIRHAGYFIIVALQTAVLMILATFIFAWRSSIVSCILSIFKAVFALDFQRARELVIQKKGRGSSYASIEEDKCELMKTRSSSSILPSPDRVGGEERSVNPPI